MEILIEVLWLMIHLIIYGFIFFYFLKSKKTYSFVKGFFLTACSLSVIDFLSYWLLGSLWAAVFPVLMGGYEYGFFEFFILRPGPFLLVYGITFLIGSEYNKEEIKTELPAMKGTRRNIGISLLLFVVTFGIYFYFWLYRTVKDLRNNFEREIPYTPGKAVGFLFIPLFNIYWMFHILFSLPLSMKRIEKKHFGKNVGFFFHPVLIPVLLIGFSMLSSLQIMLDLEDIWLRDILFFWSGSLILWLTIQAKLNAFFDSHKSSL